MTTRRESTVYERPGRPGGWMFHSGRAIAEPLDFTAELEGDPPSSLHMIFTIDGCYVPAVVRKPAGRGPFPTVICLHGGSGGLGYSFLLEGMRNRGWLFDRLVAEGFLVCYTEGRREREDAYGTDFAGVLDHHDVIEVVRYFGRRPEVDAQRMATFGVSHGGELQMKLISELEEGLAAIVPTEPAVIEYLGLRHDAGSEEGWAIEDSSGPRVEERLQFRRPVADEEIDLARAWDRIQRVPDSVRVLVMGRDDDHLQGLFKKLHELLQRAGKQVEWATFDHPEHAYQWGPERGSDGYRPDAVQQATLDYLVEFLNRNVAGRASQETARA